MMHRTVDRDVLMGFISEAKGYLPEITRGLTEFQANQTEFAVLEEPYRYTHTIKGASSMVGLASLSHIAFHLEETLEKLASGQLTLSGEMATLLHNIAAVMDLYLDEAMLGEVNDQPLLVTATQLFRRLYNQPIEEDDTAINQVLAQFGYGTSEAKASDSTSAPSPVKAPVKADAELLLAPDFATDEETLCEDEPHTLPEFPAEAPAAEAPAFDTEESQSLPELPGADLAWAVEETTPAEPSPVETIPVETVPVYTFEDLPPEPVLEELTAPPDEPFAEPFAEPLAAQLAEEPGRRSVPTAELQAKETTSLIVIHDEEDRPIVHQNVGESPTTDEATDEAFAPESNPVVSPAPEVLSPFEFFRETDDVPTRPEVMEAAMETAMETAAEEPPIETTEAQEPGDDEAPESPSFVDLPDQQDEPDEQIVAPVFEAVEAEAEHEEIEVAEETAAPPVVEAPEEAPEFENAEPVLDAEQPEVTEAVTTEAVTEAVATEASPSVDIDLPPEIADDLRDIFLLEAEDHLKTISLSLADLSQNPGDRDVLQQVRRSAHSLKGSAAMVGFKSITQLAHRMEDLLDLLYEGDYVITRDIINLLFTSSDALEDLTMGGVEAGKLTAIYEEFDKLLGSEGESPGLRQETVGPADGTPEVAFDELESLAQPEFDNPEAYAIPDASAINEVSASYESVTSDSPQAASNEPRQYVEVLSLLQESLATAEMPEATPTFTEAAEPVTEEEPAYEVEMAPEGEITNEGEAAVETAEVETVEVETVEVEIAESATAAETAGAPTTQRQSQTLRVPLGRLDEMVKLVSELVISRTAFEQRMADFARLDEELQGSSERLRRVATRLETQYEASTLGGGQSFLLTAPMNGNAVLLSNPIASLATFNTHGFDDLEFDRYTEFHLLSREVSETTSDIQTLANEYHQLLGDFDSYLNRQGRLYSEVQDKLMRVRLVPLATLSARLQRAVRNIAGQQAKQVQLHLEGAATELDKSVLEEIVDPLQHILRNAVDHGIEPPELRQVKGKAVEATIRVRAFYEGTQVIIQISDDGVGIDPELLRATAIRRGYATDDEAARMSDEQLLSLIFAPGFSTAEEVSEVSGRGIGMDIVKATVHKLKGSIAVDSVVGSGTTFTIRLPMMLAITRALMVKANNEVFAVPLTFISQIVRVIRSEIEPVPGQEGEGPALTFAGESYPVHFLAGALNLKGQPETSSRPPVLLMNLDGQRVAMCVDELLGGSEIVVKNLGNHLRSVKGVSGATVMGDGSVVLILNPTELFNDLTRATVQPGTAPPLAAKAVSRTVTVLIVDDSPSVRRVVSNVIRGANWDALQAKDGLEALELLHQAKILPDVILLDIEMPRMDGYELLKNLRAQPEYKELPVVMLTSRAGERHREKAFAFGATEYLVKPYQDETLLELIKELATARRG